jgi:hypothetical protein
MRSEILRRLFLGLLLAGCASGAPEPALDLTEDVALARFSRAAPSSLEGKGRLGVRTPDGESSFSFRLSFDESLGLRVDLTWKAFVGLVRRDGCVLVRGDSVWLDAPDNAEPGAEGAASGPTRIELLGGLAPEELVLALLGATGDLEGRRGELADFSADPEKKGYVITLERRERVETLTIIASTGDLREREIFDRTRERRLRLLYDRFAEVDGARRPAVVDVRDSQSGARIRFVFSEQAVGRRQDPARFEPPSGARLLGGFPHAWEQGIQAGGTFDSLGCF